MSKANHGSKILAFILVAIIGAAAGFGYFTRSATLTENQAEAKPAATTEITTETKTETKTDAKTETPTAPPSALTPRPGDIILGDANAKTTVVEYMSLSCTHCAHFHQATLPDIEKEFITPGKVKFILRHFPLNEPAIKGAQLVECAGQNNQDRKNFVKVLLEMQTKWAADQNFLSNLKQIASVGGIDSATFDSCMNDKALETKILASRKEGEEILKVDSTPYFFINGVKYEGERDVAGFRKALTAAQK